MDTRERLVVAATALLDEGGPEAVTLREVGARVGVSHNTPYRHFADKKDLLATVAALALRDLAERVEAAGDTRAGAAGAGETGAGPVRRAALAYLAWARERPARFRLVFGAWAGRPHAELATAAAAAVEALRRQVSVAVGAGALTGDPDRLAMMIWALGHGAVDLEMAGHLQKHAASPTPEALVTELLGRLAG